MDGASGFASVFPNVRPTLFSWYADFGDSVDCMDCDANCVSVLACATCFFSECSGRAGDAECMDRASGFVSRIPVCSQRCFPDVSILWIVPISRIVSTNSHRATLICRCIVGIVLLLCFFRDVSISSVVCD
jgi:hypothetical protein